METDQNITIRDEETCCDRVYFNICHPTGKGHRFIALVFMCFLGFGAYFCYDNPSALHDHFIQDLNLTETQYTALYSIYSWPNVIMCFIGGFLIDRLFGIRLGSNIFMSLTLIGQLVFTFAVYLNAYWLMMVGRFVFGIGSESLAVAQNNYAVLWFKGKELNMVFGLQMSFSRIGSTVNFWVMEPIYKWVSNEADGSAILGFSLLIATATCVFSMFSSTMLGLMDKRAERITGRSENQSTEVVKLTDIKNFKPTFWLLCCICVTYYNAIFPFIGVAQGFFIKRFHLSDQEANNASSLIYLVSGIASPLTGILIDKCGLNILWILISTSFTIIAHLLLGFTSFNPYIGVVILGLSYSVLASGLWPMVSLVVPEYQLGTAYGMCQSVQNLGIAVSTLITGQIVDRFGYRVLSEFFFGNLFLAFILTAIVLILDQQTKGILNLTPEARKRRQEDLLNEIAERQRLMSTEEEPSTTYPPTADDSQNPSSDDSRIRNRYLNVVGANFIILYNRLSIWKFYI
ncbi:hypothetical protein ABEB36_012219 [Hypothenemus hampei]|uniref:Lysosomal dipeptide transporter MFSD1 n=1 Tax=Hypothenemus hampei TaxID=57062 RepID=A0ABD1EAN7_HYPHA